MIRFIYSFNKLILNIFHDFIPNKIIICNDKILPWFNDEIRQILNIKNELSKLYHNGELQSDYDRFQCIRSDLVKSTRSSKENFIIIYPLNYPQELTGQCSKCSW